MSIFPALSVCTSECEHGSFSPVDEVEDLHRSGSLFGLCVDECCGELFGGDVEFVGGCECVLEAGADAVCDEGAGHQFGVLRCGVAGVLDGLEAWHEHRVSGHRGLLASCRITVSASAAVSPPTQW